MKEAPIRVTEAERDRFITDFNRRLRYASWSIIPSMFCLLGPLVLLIPDVNSASAQFAMWIGIGIISGPFLLAFYWAWNAPARELARRPLVGAARTSEEVKRMAFARMTYGQLGFAAVAALLMVWNASAKHGVFHGWRALWLVFAEALIVGVGIQAIRKWKHERS